MHQPRFPRLAPRLSPLRRFIQTSLLAACLLGAFAVTMTARAEDPESDYTEIYIVINAGDDYSRHGDVTHARERYEAAQAQLQDFQKNNPNWNPQVVSFRLNYCTEKLAAIKKAETEATQASQNTASGSNGEGKAVSAAPKGVVTVIDAGSEPRSELRLHPVVGDKQNLTMTMKMGMDMSMPGNNAPNVDIPAIKISMTTEVKEIAENGDITYQLTCNDASVVTDDKTVPMVAAAMKTALGGINGMSGTGKVSNRGILLSMQMKAPAGSDPAAAQMVDQMKDAFSSSSTPLPEEAVGAGAKWEYKSKLKSQGMTINQTYSSELVSVDGDKLTLKNSISQNAASQKVSNPAMPGMKVNVDKMSGAGTGTSTVDLTHLLPISASMDESMETSMVMDMGKQKQTMDMKMKMNVTFESN